jgi:hypothetical protein
MQPLDIVFALFAFSMLFAVVGCLWQALARTLDVSQDAASHAPHIDASVPEQAGGTLTRGG